MPSNPSSLRPKAISKLSYSAFLHEGWKGPVGHLASAAADEGHMSPSGLGRPSPSAVAAGRRYWRPLARGPSAYGDGPGFDQVQVHVDYLSGRVHALPTRSTATSAEAAQIILQMAMRSGDDIPDLLVAGGRLAARAGASTYSQRPILPRTPLSSSGLGGGLQGRRGHAAGIGFVRRALVFAASCFGGSCL